MSSLRLLAVLSVLTVAAGAGCSGKEPATTGGTGGAGSGGDPGAGSGGSAGAAMGTGGATGGNGAATGGAGGQTVNDDAAGTDATAVVDSSTDGSTAALPTTGCGKPVGQTTAMYVAKNIMVGTRARSYRIFVPAGYDPMHPYPTVFLGHGCGGNGGTPFPFEAASKDKAIVIALKSVGSCFDDQSPTSFDFPYFDQVLAEVSANLCVDKARVFMAGFSSGSWLTNLLGCGRAGVIRGQGNATGGLPAIPACTGPIAGMLAHDTTDDQNSFAGGQRARDRLLMVNGCSTQTLPYDFDGDPATPSTCVIYQGCKPGYPVVWCPTTGKGHSSQVPITTVGLWRFFSQF
jgi:polyhydroxybutyrate depolymerase